MSSTTLASTMRPAAPTAMMEDCGGISETVMSVLNGIRAVQASGMPYDPETNLTDAGFTSVEMVKVMLGIEAAFDLMIPQDMITPENFTSATTIANMVEKLTQDA